MDTVPVVVVARTPVAVAGKRKRRTELSGCVNVGAQSSLSRRCPIPAIRVIWQSRLYPYPRQKRGGNYHPSAGLSIWPMLVCCCWLCCALLASFVICNFCSHPLVPRFVSSCPISLAFELQAHSHTYLSRKPPSPPPRNAAYVP